MPNPHTDAERDVILQVLVTRTAAGVEAHCLQMDIVTEAPTVEEAMDDICDLIRAQYRFARDTDNVASVFVPAPKEAWEQLAHARPTGMLRTIDLSGPSEHSGADVPSYAIQELTVAS